MNTKPSFIKTVALLCIIVQILLTTVCNNVLGSVSSPIVLTVVSLIPGLILLKYSFKKNCFIVDDIRYDHYIKWIGIIGALLFLLMSYNVFSIFPDTHKNAKYSDIIPLVEKFISRFINGEYPYTVISDWGYDLIPTYQPLHWMPFLIPKIIGADIRWTPVLIFTIATLILHWAIIKSRFSSLIKVLTCAGLWFLILLFVLCNTFLHSITIEPIIERYNLLLATSLYSKNSFFKAASITLCMLSRYALVLWIPLYFLVELMRDTKRTIRISLFVLLGVLIFYVPFAIVKPTFTLDAFAYYQEVTSGHWEEGYFNADALFKDGVGMAHPIRVNIKADRQTQLKYCKNIQVWGSLLLIVAMALFYYRKRESIDNNTFLLASLAVYLAFFFSFVIMPFRYLFLTPMFINFLVVMALYQKKIPTLSS